MPGVPLYSPVHTGAPDTGARAQHKHSRTNHRPTQKRATRSETKAIETAWLDDLDARAQARPMVLETETLRSIDRFSPHIPSGAHRGRHTQASSLVFHASIKPLRPTLLVGAHCTQMPPPPPHKVLSIHGVPRRGLRTRVFRGRQLVKNAEGADFLFGQPISGFC